MASPGENLPFPSLYFRGSSSVGMADKIALKNTYNFSVTRGVSLLRNIQFIFNLSKVAQIKPISMAQI